MNRRFLDRTWLNGQQFYRVALCISVLIQVAHVISLPLLVTFDGHWYIRLAEILGTPSFSEEWDYLRTPLYPAVLKLAFWIFGEHAITVVALQSALGFAGIWALSQIPRRLGRPAEAAIILLVLSAYPTLIAYEHAVLTEAGTFVFLAGLIYLLSASSRGGIQHAGVLAGLLSVAFYYRSSILPLAPLVGLLYVLVPVLSGPKSPATPGYTTRRLVRQALIIAVVPFVVAYPWQRKPKVETRTETVIDYGLARQAVIPPEDPVWGEAEQEYYQAINLSSTGGRFPLSGIHGGAEYKFTEVLDHRRPGLVATALKYPERYCAGVARNLLFFGGLGRLESDNAGWRNLVLNSDGTLIQPGPPSFRSIDSQFAQDIGPSLVRHLLASVGPFYDFLVFLGFMATSLALIIGLRLKDPVMVQAASIPLGFIFIQALILSSQDRFAAPAYPLLLMNLVMVPRWLTKHAANQVGAGHRRLRLLGQYALASLLLLIGFLSVFQIAYLFGSGILPSADMRSFRGEHVFAKPTDLIGLKSLDAETMVYLDSINGAAPSQTSALNASRSTALEVFGWAVDSPNHARAEAVDIDIGGRLFKATYGTPRPDVSAALRDPEYEKSGYAAEIPLSEIPKGAQKLTIRVINANGTGYYTGPTVSILLN
jgi:hypothetical protein